MSNWLMTKFGTPIGAGPKEATVVVGLAPVGVPFDWYGGGGWLFCFCWLWPWCLALPGPTPPV